MRPVTHQLQGSAGTGPPDCEQPSSAHSTPHPSLGKRRSSGRRLSSTCCLAPRLFLLCSPMAARRIALTQTPHHAPRTGSEQDLAHGLLHSGGEGGAEMTNAFAPAPLARLAQPLTCACPPSISSPPLPLLSLTPSLARLPVPGSTSCFARSSLPRCYRSLSSYSPFTLTSCTTVCDGSVSDHRQTLIVTRSPLPGGLRSPLRWG